MMKPITPLYYSFGHYEARNTEADELFIQANEIPVLKKYGNTVRDEIIKDTDTGISFGR